MPRGGRRYGAGRPTGSLGYSRAAIIEAAKAMGEAPIAYMLRVMHDTKAAELRRDRMARELAAYFYSRPAPVPDISPEEAAAQAKEEAALAAADAAEAAELAAVDAFIKQARETVKDLVTNPSVGK